MPGRTVGKLLKILAIILTLVLMIGSVYASQMLAGYSEQRTSTYSFYAYDYHPYENIAVAVGFAGVFISCVIGALLFGFGELVCASHTHTVQNKKIIALLTEKSISEKTEQENV